MNDIKKLIRKRYTRVVRMGKKWNAYLQIDHQGFCVVEQTSRKRADYFADMLAVALARFGGAYGSDDLRVRIHPAIGRYVLDAAKAASLPFAETAMMALCFGASQIIKSAKKIKTKGKK